jgi:hypothetical protein
MSTREKLKDYLKVQNEEFINIIDNVLKADEIQFAIDYIEKLNTISSHKITNIGRLEKGEFFVNCETGITYLN